MVLVVVWALVYLPWLGGIAGDGGGLADTEGHRAIPGWTMLESGDWIVPRMFEQAYMRKPPGMPWAVGVSAAVFGESAWSARLVSAVASFAMALAGWWYARKWFGARFAVAGGLATLLMPWLWSSGRSAEIEALNNAACAWVMLGVLDFALWTRPRGWAIARAIGWLSIPMVVMLFAKGPAGLPAVGGALIAVVLVRRSWKPIANPVVWGALAVGAAVLGAWWVAAHARVDAEGASAITQSPGSFFFEAGRLVGVALLVPTALVSALPASLAMVFVWGGDARAEARVSARAGKRYAVAWALTLTPMLTAGALMVVGVGNPRYALPAVVGLGPLVAWVLGGVYGPLVDGGFDRTRSAIGRAMAMGRPMVWVAVLIAGSWAYIWTMERADRRTSGEGAGRVLAAQVADGAGLVPSGELMVVANDAIEARPEVLWSLQAELAARGARLRWMPGFRLDAEALEPGVVVVVRVDAASAEREWAAHHVNLGNLAPLSDEPVRVHRYELRACLWIGPATD